MNGLPDPGSSLLPHHLRQSLRRFQIVVQTGTTHGGVGERRSRSKGEGIEFEDFRPYAFGDDMRRLDPHVYSRLGQPVIRQYNVPERLAVTILVDLSASMDFGAPAKAEVAKAVAAGLALCALAGGDTVRCGVLGDGSVEWFPRLSGAGRFDDLHAWLAGRGVGGAPELSRAVAAAKPDLPAGGVCVLIGDMWGDDADRALDHLREADQDPIVVRVLAPEELDPAAYGNGPVRFVDSETGDEVEIDLEPAAIEAYAEHLGARSARLREHVLASQGRLVDVSTAVPVADVFERHLQAAQVIK